VTIRAVRSVPEYLRLTNGPNRLCPGFLDSSRHPPTRTSYLPRWHSRCRHRPDATTVPNQAMSQRQANGPASAGTESYATAPMTTSADRCLQGVQSAYSRIFRNRRLRKSEKPSTSDELTAPSKLGFDDSPPFRGWPERTYPAFYGLRREAGRPVQRAKYFVRS